MALTGAVTNALPDGDRARRRGVRRARRGSRSRRRSSPTSTRSACAPACSRSRTSAGPPGSWSDRSSSARSRRGRAAPRAGAGRWSRSRSPRSSSRSCSFFLREPERGRNEQEAVLGRAPRHRRGPAGAPQRRRRRASARSRRFRYLILGIGVLGFALVSVPVRLSFLFDETYHFDAYKRGLGALAHLPPGAPRDPVRGPATATACSAAIRADAVRIFGCARHRVRRVPHRRLAARARSSRSSCSSRSRTRASSRRSPRSARRSRRSSRTGCARRRSRSIGFYIFLLGGFFGGLAGRGVADDYGERTALLVVVPFGALIGGLLVLSRQPVHEARHLARGRGAARRAGGAAPHRGRPRERARCSRSTTSTSATDRCRSSST